MATCWATIPLAQVPALSAGPSNPDAGAMAARPGERGQIFSQPVALEDVLPMLLDAASAPVRADLDGRSMLNLIRGNKTGWREFLQTEHDVCFSPQVHWNALTDSHISYYIFHTSDGQEQLFDLDRDPQELNGLEPDPAHAGPLRKWRERMVNYLAPRGDVYVKDGKLALRKE